MNTRLTKIRNERVKKLETLRKIGIDPYPSRVERKHSIVNALAMMGKKVSVVGRLRSLRTHGRIAFADLEDESGRIQVFFNEKILGKKQYELIQLLDASDFIAITGEIMMTKAGEISVLPSKITILGKTMVPLPNEWFGLKNIEERYRKRYIDMLLNPQVKDILKKRSEVITSMRTYLDKRGFIEVETPLLQPVYGGGFARPFTTHHNALDTDFYLRISDEMYLKRLIVGGLEKVYEITKVFRNEGVDRDHNPEFTMFEAQIAFKDYVYGMDIIEKITEHAAKTVLKKTTVEYQGKTLDFKSPWKRIKLVDSIKEQTGIDTLSWKTLEDAVKGIKKMKIPAKKMNEVKKMKTIGEIIAFAFEEGVEKKLIQPTIVYDYPIEVSPLAKKCDDSRFTQRFEMFAAGFEFGNNYTELNDALDLKKRFVEEKKREKAGFDEAHQTDYDYLRAIEYGFPPTCGLGMGIDRLVMLLTNAKTIREVLAFPTLKPENHESKI